MPSHEITGGTLERSDVIALLKDAGAPLTFIDVDFSAADLSRLPLAHCEFQRCLLSGTQFVAADIEGSIWMSCRGGEANFEAVRAQDARFTNCDFNNTRWLRAKLSHASFSACKLTGANLAHCDALGLSFNETLLRAAVLTGLSFSKSTLVNLDFTDADLTHTDFRDAVFDGGSLAHAHINGARFAGADLRDAEMSGFTLADARYLRGATISRAQASILLSEFGISVA